MYIYIWYVEVMRENYLEIIFFIWVWRYKKNVFFLCIFFYKDMIEEWFINNLWYDLNEFIVFLCFNLDNFVFIIFCVIGIV